MNLTLTRTHKLALAGGLAVLAVAAVVVYPILAPKASTTVDQAMVPGAEVLARGTLQGAGDGVHHVSGSVLLLRDAQGQLLLRFEDYQATDGPDVFLHLTPGSNPRTTAQVEAGLRVPVPGGPDGGEATLRGNFHVPLPAGVDPAGFRGLAVWCDQFNVLFGNASLA
jgi:hypothetical protein